MDRIFSKANIVLVWFGQLNDGEQTFVEVLKWLSAHVYLEETGHRERESEEENKSVEVLRASHGIIVVQLRTLYIFMKLVEAWNNERNHNAGWEDFNMFLRQCPHRTDLLPPRHPFWLSFLVYMNSDWFQRIWTQQEVALARCRCLLHPGGVVGYDVMIRCRSALFNQDYATLWGGHFAQYNLLKRRGYNRNQIVASLSRPRFRIKPQSPHALQLALSEIIGLRATLTKDYIYGLVGMLDEATRLQLSIDYSASDASVFARAVELACSQNSGASIIPFTACSRFYDNFRRSPG